MHKSTGKMRKRGYFYTMDIMFAMIALAIGFLLIWNIFFSVPSETQAYFLSQDMASFLTSTKNGELSSSYVRELINNGTISKNTYVLDQVVIFLETLEPQKEGLGYNYSSAYLGEITKGVVPKQYNFLFLMGNKPVYNNSIYTGRIEANPADADVLVSSKKIVIAEIDEGNGNFTLSTPYIAEVVIWI